MTTPDPRLIEMYAICEQAIEMASYFNRNDKRRFHSHGPDAYARLMFGLSMCSSQMKTLVQTRPLDFDRIRKLRIWMLHVIQLGQEMRAAASRTE